MTNPLRDILGKMTVSDAMTVAAEVLFGKEGSAKGPEKPVGESKDSFDSVPRRFLLWRTKDHSGVSGTGYVATGVEFPDGTVAVRWFGKDPSTSLWKNVAALEAVHGHHGSTAVEWMD